MSGSIPPFPLAWPQDVPRTVSPQAGSFKTSLGAAITNVEDSLRRFAGDSKQRVSNVQITSNKAGLTNAAPADCGVAIWFEWDGQQRCIAVDRYLKLEHNVQAIHHIIEARRTELRHGGMNVVRQTFRGFTALPAPAGQERGWWKKVLGLGDQGHVLPADIRKAFNELAKLHHPDKGGDAEAFQRLCAARDAGLVEVGT